MYILTLAIAIAIAAPPVEQFTTTAGKPLDPDFLSAVVQPLEQSHLVPLALKCLRYPATDVFFRVEVRLNWSDPLAVDTQAVEVFRGKKFVLWDGVAQDCLDAGLKEIKSLPELSPVEKHAAGVVGEQITIIYYYNPSELSP